MANDFNTPSNGDTELLNWTVPRSHQDRGSDGRVSDAESSLLGRSDVKSGHHVSFDEVAQSDRKSERTHQRTVYLITGSYAAAWLFAIAHYTFFRVLDGKDVSNSFALKQSHVSIISLLLVTAFRAVVIAVLSICFTQYLWYLLRVQTLKISMIESLFQVRSNALELINPRMVRQTPLLFVAATLCWLVPLATVYPPSALTIQSEQSITFTNVNASVMNPKPESLGWRGMSSLDSLADILSGSSTASSYRDVDAYYSGPKAALLSIGRFVMSSGQTVPMRPLSGENSSYVLEFQGPRVRCHNLTNTSATINFEETFNTVLFNGSWGTEKFGSAVPILNLTYTEPVGYQPAPRIIDGTTGGECHEDSYRPDTNSTVGCRLVPPLSATVTGFFEDRIMQCDAYTAKYQAKVAYVRGIQSIEFNLTEEEKLPFPRRTTFEWNSTEHTKLPNNTQRYKDWEQELPTWAVQANVRAILDAVGYTLDLQWHQAIRRGHDSERMQLPNGTEAELGGLWNDAIDMWGKKNYTILEDSVLNRNRFAQSIDGDFDPRRDLLITESALNELLANVSFSALSMNTWHAFVNVTDSQFRNLYRFSHPLNLLLPYGLCLGLAIVFIAVGLAALSRNGTPATDGGFLQVMMTTTGNTAISREAGVGSIGGKMNAPKELLDLKVRFGELVAEGETAGSVRCGFGTVEETRALRRRR